MTTELLFREDPYRQDAEGRVLALTEEGGIVLDRTIFYPTGGGQPGDSGWLLWGETRLPIATTLKVEGGRVALIPAEPGLLPPVGTELSQRLDWPRRHLHMRIHTALHLLSVVVPRPVTGGQIRAGSGRLDFDMPEPPNSAARIEAELNALIERDLPVSESWISEAELEANPGLVKTLSVRPPSGQGRIRLVRIGDGADPVDLQPCGGTHVARTAEIGRVAIEKIENKGRQNRRISIALIE